MPSGRTLLHHLHVFCSTLPPPPSVFACAEVRSTPEAPAAARERLAKMGPLSIAEKYTLVCLGAAVVMWMGGEALDIPAVQAAMIALSGLLATGVLTWKDCLDYTPAWDTLVWWVPLGLCLQLFGCPDQFVWRVARPSPGCNVAGCNVSTRTAARPPWAWVGRHGHVMWHEGLPSVAHRRSCRAFLPGQVHDLLHISAQFTAGRRSLPADPCSCYR